MTKSKHAKYASVRVTRERLIEWSALVDKAIAEGMPSDRGRSSNRDVDDALALAIAYTNGLMPTMRIEPKILDMINARINFKTCQMIETLCDALDLSVTPKLRPDGHLELMIGDRGSFILPQRHYNDRGKLSDEDDQLGEFVTTGPAN